MRFYDRRIRPWLIDLALRNKPIGDQRAAALREVSGAVLEVGFGTGLSVQHYPPGVSRLYALDPGTPPFRRVAQRIEAAPFPVVRLPFDAARPYPLEDASVDAVTSMFALCTIADPHAALREMLRVLKPGGAFYFLEHGLAESAALRRWQTLASPLWGCCTGGCRLDRDIPHLIAAASFREVRHIRCAVATVPPFMGRLYRGSAIKGG